MRDWLSAVAGIVLSVILLPAAAQVDVREADIAMFPADTTYDPAIPTPAEFIGFELGSEPVRHHQLVDYLKTVAGMSDRLSLEVIGYTHERRPILFLVATTPGNHAPDIKWEDYTHINFPSSDYEEYDPEFAPRLRQWVAEGGTAIAMRDAVPWLRAATLDWIDPESEEALAAAAAVPEPGDEEAEEPERSPYSEKDDHEAQRVIGGAIFAADLDTTHPLGFGFRDRAIYLHKNVEEPLLPTANPFATVIAYTDDPVFSGFVSAENRDALAGTPSLIAERSGEGSIILFADNPNFRGYWYGTNKLFLNALFFSKLFEPLEED